jgi:type II secretory pathway pseudopilin PulG
MNLHLKVWRQKEAKSDGRLVDVEARNIPEDCSFLEMLDIVNEDLVGKGEEPIAFDHDCREGICGTCSLTIDGVPHGPSETTTCQLYMRKFKDGDTIHIEPFRARPFPVVRDLMVDRSAFDRIQQAGGFITARTGSAPEGNSLPIGKHLRLQGFTLVELMVATAVIIIVGIAGVQALAMMNSKAAAMRILNNARAAVQRNIDTAMGVPYTTAAVPAILATTPATGTVYVDSGTGNLETWS